MKQTLFTTFVIACLAMMGCAGKGKHKKYPGPASDRPFPLGQVSDAHWETQQTNAEAADFIFYDHEFRYDTIRHVDTAELAPAAKKHLEMVALRLEHVPFPIVIEESEHNARPELDQQRRRTIVENLNRMGVTNADARVVVGNAFPAGFTSVEAERSYRTILGGGANGFGRRFGGAGGAYR